MRRCSRTHVESDHTDWRERGVQRLSDMRARPPVRGKMPELGTSMGINQIPYHFCMRPMGANKVALTLKFSSMVKLGHNH